MAFTAIPAFLFFARIIPISCRVFGINAIVRPMILAKADKSGKMLTMSYSQHVGADEMKRCLGTIRDIMPELQPGFVLLSDLSSLESMDASCAADIGAIMDLCDAKGMDVVVRVIPDPNKDIGFAVLSCFHERPQLQTQTYDNLADAVQSLYIATPATTPGS